MTGDVRYLVRPSPLAPNQWQWGLWLEQGDTRVILHTEFGFTSKKEAVASAKLFRERAGGARVFSQDQVEIQPKTGAKR